jgi:hypothetical protein
MTFKNLAISGLTATAVLFLTAVFFLGYRIWLSPTGVGLAASISIIAFSGAALSLRRQNTVSANSENVLQPGLPGWVRTWQRIGALLLVLLLLTFFFFK